MLNAIKASLSDAFDRLDEARFARLRRQLPIRNKFVKMDGQVHLFHHMWYDLPDCPDSAGYVGLRALDRELYISSLVERDFHRPRFKEAVFINGKKLPTKVDGLHVEQHIPFDSEIMFIDSKEVRRAGRTRWVPELVRVLPLREVPYRH